jgi:CDP-glucose 4,6-dehydratase
MNIKRILKIYQGKKVLITGHTGFKGSWLSIWLNYLGANVTGIALDPKTERDVFVLSGIGKKINDYRIDIRNLAQLLEVFEKEQPEIVFHLAAQPLVLESYHNPVETFETNISGTVNVLEAIRQTDSVKTAIMITTDKVYENKEWIWPYREDDPLGGYDPYSASKAAAELVISSYRKSFFNPDDYKRHQKSVASVRAGNVIGGGDWADFRIIPDCIRAIEHNKPVEVRSPQSIRPWQHVLEPLGGYLLLGGKMMADPQNYAQAWNFGPAEENIVNVGVLVDLLVKEYGKGEWLDISGKKKLHEANLLSLDISKAKYKLGWHPVLDIRQTVKFTVDWYKQYKLENVYNLCIAQIDEYQELWKLRNEN